jgi:hypothetical protein
VIGAFLEECNSTVTGNAWIAGPQAASASRLAYANEVAKLAAKRLRQFVANIRVGGMATAYAHPGVYINEAAAIGATVDASTSNTEFINFFELVGLPDLESTSARSARWTYTVPQQQRGQIFDATFLLQVAALCGLVICPLSPAYARWAGDSSQQIVAQQKTIDETIVQPCRSERKQKAEAMRTSIAGCDCSDAVKQQNTLQLEAVLQKEMQRCEQKGADALDQFKHELVSNAQDDFSRYSGQVEVDRQLLHNFGFNRTAEEMESWTHYGKRAQEKYVREAKNEVLAKFFQSIHLKVDAWAAAPHMTSEKAVSLYNLFKAVAVKDDALLNALAAAGRGDPQIPERALWVEIAGALEKLNDAREVLHTERDSESIFNAVLTVAGWMAPEIVPYVGIVKDASWIGYATYTHAKVAYGLHDIDRLSTLTEAQREELEPVAHRLKQDVDGLVAAKKVLQWAAATGNNSNMVR